MKYLTTLLLLLSLSISTIAFSATVEEEIEATTQAWANAYDSRVTENTTSLYHPNAVFWGTTSQSLRDTPPEVRDYFKGMPDRPDARVTIGEHRIRVFGETAVNTGFYTFTDRRDGKATTFPARFTFVYHKQADGSWLIVDHHSSAIPPQPN